MAKTISKIEYQEKAAAGMAEGNTEKGANDICTRGNDQHTLSELGLLNFEDFGLNTVVPLANSKLSWHLTFEVVIIPKSQKVLFFADQCGRGLLQCLPHC